MSLATQSIRYGWKALVGIALTGGTIYVATNQPWRISQRDIIEILLGTHERCLVKGITPPEYVQTMMDGTNAVTVTNTMGWRVIAPTAADATIKTLVPLFNDPITLAPLTVTGLWASLNIGDHTNQFTAYSWRANRAALEERYKVLNAMSVTINGEYTRTGKNIVDATTNSWNNAKTRAEAFYTAQTNDAGPEQYFEAWTAGKQTDTNRFSASMWRATGTIGSTNSQTNVAFTATLWLQGTNGPFIFTLPTETNYTGNTFNDFGDGVSTNYEVQQTSTSQLWFTIGDLSYPFVPWCNPPSMSTWNTYGYRIIRWNVVVNWHFIYATNKYW